MKNRTIKIGIKIGAFLAVVYPLWIRLKGLNWAIDASLFPNLFPALGLAAFALLWLHSISGVFEPWLRKNFDFDSYVNNTALLILLLMILHPLFLLATFNFNWPSILSAYEEDDVWIGVVGLILLLTYDIGKGLKKYNFFVRNWNNILLVSTIGFLFIFFHSIALGSDLQSGHLRFIWIFYGITGILATIYTYGIKRFFMKNFSQGERRF